MYLLFDIGGTSMRLASSDGKKIIKLVKAPTPSKFGAALKTFAKLAGELKIKSLKAAAGGLAGPFNKQTGQLLIPPNLPLWRGKNVKKEFQKILKVPVFLENDAALAGLGEAHFGAGRDKNIVAYLTISTGIGGARIVNGKIDANALGFEPGVQILDIASQSTFENYASGKALQKKYKTLPSDIKNKKIWQQEAYALACGLANVIALWSPEIVVLGGGVILTTPLSLKLVGQNLKKVLKIFPKHPPIKKAQLEDKSGLYGALVFLKQQK